MCLAEIIGGAGYANVGRTYQIEQEPSLLS